MRIFSSDFIIEVIFKLHVFMHLYYNRQQFFFHICLKTKYFNKFTVYIIISDFIIVWTFHGNFPSFIKMFKFFSQFLKNNILQ